MVSYLETGSYLLDSHRLTKFCDRHSPKQDCPCIDHIKRPLLVLTADLSTCCQLLANCWKKWFDQIQCYFSINKLTTDFQHAYRKGHSTCTALTQMTDDCFIRRLWERLDFSAAFDSIAHNLLLRELMCYGFSTSAISWIQSHLSDRIQRVLFNGSFSVKHVKCGVPQGSSLCALLFFLYFNQ